MTRTLLAPGINKFRQWTFKPHAAVRVPDIENVTGNNFTDCIDKLKSVVTCTKLGQIQKCHRPFPYNKVNSQTVARFTMVYF